MTTHSNQLASNRYISRIGLIFLACASLWLSGCVMITKVEPAEQKVGSDMTVKPDAAWNDVTRMMGNSPAQVWTLDGISLDLLSMWGGIGDGQRVNAMMPNEKAKEFSFRSTMSREELLALFEGVLSRNGSQVTLVKAEPAPFLGRDGLRFEFMQTQQADQLKRQVTGFANVVGGKLYAIVYNAPALAFYERNAPRVQAIVNSARVPSQTAAPPAVLSMAPTVPVRPQSMPVQTVSPTTAVALAPLPMPAAPVAAAAPATAPTTVSTSPAAAVVSAAAPAVQPTAVSQPPAVTAPAVVATPAIATLPSASPATPAVATPVTTPVTAPAAPPASATAVTNTQAVAAPQAAPKPVVATTPAPPAPVVQPAAQTTPAKVTPVAPVVTPPVVTAATPAPAAATAPVSLQGLKAGISSFTVERLAKAAGCQVQPPALVLEVLGPQQERYVVPCQDNRRVTARCEYRQCTLE